MKLYTMTELLMLNREELNALYRLISMHLLVLHSDAIERREALENLDTIRRVLNRPFIRPWHRRPMSPAP
jgi:hypothetical protein